MDAMALDSSYGKGSEYKLGCNFTDMGFHSKNSSKNEAHENYTR